MDLNIEANIQISVDYIKQEIAEFSVLDADIYSKILWKIQGYQWGLRDCGIDYSNIINELTMVLESKWQQLLNETQDN